MIKDATAYHDLMDLFAVKAPSSRLLWTAIVDVADRQFLRDDGVRNTA